MEPCPALHLDLLIPDLLPPPWPAGIEPLAGLDTPGLEWLLGRGRISPLPDACAEHWLCRIHDLEGYPAAPYALLAEGLDPGEWLWLHADPVHLQLNLDRLRVLDARAFPLEAEESAALLAELNRFAAPLNMAAFSPHPSRWYLRAKEAPSLDALPLSLQAGQDLDPRRDLGEGQPFWQRLLSEIQVAFHHLPVNENRVEAGVPPVNGIWPWGGGRLRLPARRPYDAVHADHLLARGLALAAKVPAHATPADHAGLNPAGTTLVVLEDLAAPARYGDGPGWAAAMARLENHWFAPLSRDLRRGRIASLRIVAPHAERGMSISLHAADRWKLWRGPRSLHQFSG